MSGTHWTTEQKEFLIKNIGVLSYDTIAKKVGKTPRATRQKKVRMELGDPKEISDYVTIKYLAKIIHSSVRTINKWIKDKELKANYKILAHRQKISRINLTDFWKWAEEHQNLINWSKFEFRSLGIEPKWTKETRRNCKRKRISWTKEKENLLESYFKIGLSWKQIGKNFNITADAARSRHNLILHRRAKEE